MSTWWEPAALVFLDVVLWVMVARVGRPSRADRRLWKYTARDPSPAWRRAAVVGPLTATILQRAAVWLRRLTPAARRQQEATSLARAGLEWEPKWLEGLKVAAALAGIAPVAIAGHSGILPGSSLGWMAVAGGAGYLSPLLWVRRRGAARERELRRALPDTLDVLVICLRAGLGLQAAVAEYARNASGVAGEAFRRYLADLALGRTPEDGLAEMARCYPGDDLAVVVSALVQGIRLGSPLAEVLEDQATHFRALALRRAEEGARKLATRLVLPLVAFIFPQVFIIGLGPVGLRLLGPGGLLR